MKSPVPRSINPKVKILLNHMNIKNDPEFIQIDPLPFSEFDNCFLNIEKAIKKYGGKMIIGWQLWESSFFIEAEFHGIWKTNDNEIIDITPKKYNIEKILFIPDEKIVYEGKRKDNIRVNTSSNPIVDDYIQLNEYKFKILYHGDNIFIKDNFIKISEQEKYLIENIEYISACLEKFINEGNYPDSNCFCERNKKYYHCHGLDLHNTFIRLKKKYG